MAARETAFLASPTPTSNRGVLASPFQFFTTGEEHLRIEVLNSAGGVRVALHYRFLDPERGIIANTASHTPTSDRSVTRTDVRLGAGALLNLTVFADVGSPHYGQTFVRVQLVRGFGGATVVMGTIVQGYVTASQDLAWPGSPVISSTDGNGLVRNMAGTTPAAGAQISETVPNGARWKLITLYCVLTTSAAVANRQVELVLIGGGIQRFVSPAPAVQVASTGIAYAWACGVTPASAPIAVVQIAGLPTDPWLCESDELRVTAANLQVGDQFSNVAYLTQEWLEGA